MKSLKIYLQILIVGLFFSCNDKNDVVSYGTPLNTISFDFEKDVKEPDVFFDLVDSIKLVKLQTNTDYIIGRIEKILFDKDFIYILDNNSSKSLYKYTKEGEFVLKISRLGKGPGEFIEPSDFCLLDDAIVIFDRLSTKVIFYNKNGQFIREFKQKSFANRFAKIGTNYFAMLNENNTPPFSKGNKNIFIINDQGKKVNEFFEIPKYLINKNYSLWRLIEYNEDEVLYTQSFNTRIFGITKDSVYVKYFFDFGEYNLDESFLNSNKKLTITDLSSKLNNKNMVRTMDYFCENSKYFSFLALKRGRLIDIYYNKEENTPYIFYHDLFPMWLRFLTPQYMYSDDQFFISVCPPNYQDIVKEQEMNKMKENRIFSSLYEELIQTDEMSNPYLLYFYFK